jgi:hypothetical protein
MSTQKFLIMISTLISFLLTGCDNKEELEGILGGNVDGSTKVEGDKSINYVNVISPRGTSGKWLEEWSKAVGNAIDEHSRGLVMDVTIPASDLNALNCPGFNDARENDKKRFWALFMASISLYESSYNPNTRYWETGLNLWSEGLFQLSVSTGKYHEGCGHITKENILNPLANIKCAVAVMRNQMRVRGSLFPYKAYYWSVLTTYKKYKVQSFFKSQMGSLSFCQL